MQVQLPTASLSFIGYLTGVAVGGVTGLVAYRLLAPVRKLGVAGFVLAQWLAWASGMLMGLIAMVNVAGPYVFAGPQRDGTYSTDPFSIRDGLWFSVICAAIAALMAVLKRRRANRRYDD
jgi:hypothetical protein